MKDDDIKKLKKGYAMVVYIHKTGELQTTWVKLGQTVKFSNMGLIEVLKR